MKNTIFFLVILIFSCEKGKPGAEIFQVQESGSKRWDIYEGRVPLSEETHLYLEVAMLPSDVLGEGSYRLTETLQEKDELPIVSELTGTYSTIYGEGPEDLIVQFHNSAHLKGLKRTYLSNGGLRSNSTNPKIRVLKEESFRGTDLTLKRQGKNKLLVLDQRLEAITFDTDYNLTKRSSKLFTVEGYFRHNGDTADFFEINTQEKWAVSKLGEYETACKEYHRLVDEKFEVTYLKATAYAINHSSQSEEQMEALVFKKILQMTSTPELDPR